jgi:YD repeat-containing protein
MQWLLAANWNQYRYAGDFTPSSTLIPIGPTPHAVTPPTAVPTGYPAALDVILNGEGQLVGHHTLDYVGLDNFMGWYVGYEWDSPDGGTIIDIYEKDPVISASTQWYLHVYDNTGASGDGAGITADVAFNVDGSLTFSSWAAWDDVTNDPISLADGGLQDAIGGASGPIGLTLAYADTTHYSEKTTYRYDDATTVAASERLGLGRLVEVDDEVRPISMTINDNQTPVEHFTHQTYDPITGQVASITSNEGTIHYEYDANGSLLTTTKGGQTTRYVWDLRNRMVGIDANNDGNTADTGDTNIAYDSNGVRASELTVGGTSTYFLNDPNNPTGYTKAVEEKPSAGSAPSRSYVFGQKVEGQSDATNGTLYFMTDGHGSTRALIDLGAAVQEREDYDAFGTLLGTLTATSSKTTWLFGGDGLWDPATGWTYHLARWRNGFAFTSYDSFEADPTSPATLHKYEYANNNPLIYLDGSGNSLVGELLTVANISRVVVGIAFGLSGSWNIAHSVFDVEQAFSLARHRFDREVDCRDVHRFGEHPDREHLTFWQPHSPFAACWIGGTPCRFRCCGGQSARDGGDGVRYEPGCRSNSGECRWCVPCR